MKQFDYENYVKNLPDCYNKTESGNNFKILETERISLDALFVDIESVLESLDIEKATGKTLDLYGEMLSQPRGVATDTQYRLLIKSKIMQNISTGNYKSIVNAICVTFNCSPAEVLIKEKEDSPCVVEMAILPLDVINNAGLTVTQTVALIERLLPIGVTLESYLFRGTFMFQDDDWIATTTNGFASDDGTIEGGYLGIGIGEENEAILPID